MEKISQDSGKGSSIVYPIDFKNGAIQIKFFENEFLFVNFEEEQRVKFPLSAFEFKTDNIKKLREQYKVPNGKGKETKEAQIDNIIFSDFQFVPIQEFKDVDQIIHIPDHFVYLLRCDLTSNSKSRTVDPKFRECPKIYKFDFLKLE